MSLKLGAGHHFCDAKDQSIENFITLIHTDRVNFLIGMAAAAILLYIEYLIREHMRSLRRAHHVNFYVTMPDDEIWRIDNVILKDTQKVDLSIEVQDARGNAAKVDGIPSWELSDLTVAELTVAEDGMSAVLAGKNIGATSVKVSVDADLGEGTKPILGSLDVEVTGGDATIVSIKAGEPSDQ